MPEILLRVLYIGKPDRGDDLQRALNPRGDYVYQPEKLLEALGNYVFFAPQLVIVDVSSGNEIAAEALPHLVEIGANLLLLGEAPLAGEVSTVLPADASVEDILAEVDILLGRVPQA